MAEKTKRVFEKLPDGKVECSLPCLRRGYVGSGDSYFVGMSMEGEGVCINEQAPLLAGLMRGFRSEIPVDEFRKCVTVSTDSE